MSDYLISQLTINEVRVTRLDSDGNPFEQPTILRQRYTPPHCRVCGRFINYGQTECRRHRIIWSLTLTGFLNPDLVRLLTGRVPWKQAPIT